VAFQLRKSGWKSARFLCDEEEVKRNETSQSDVPLAIIWNEKEYRYDTVKRVAIGVNPADGYTLFFLKGCDLSGTGYKSIFRGRAYR
jgi:hypothetical protein